MMGGRHQRAEGLAVPVLSLASRGEKMLPLLGARQMREGAAGADLYKLAGMKSATLLKKLAGIRNEHLSVEARGNVSSALFQSALCGGFTISLYPGGLGAQRFESHTDHIDSALNIHDIQHDCAWLFLFTFLFSFQLDGVY